MWILSVLERIAKEKDTIIAILERRNRQKPAENSVNQLFYLLTWAHSIKRNRLNSTVAHLRLSIIEIQQVERKYRIKELILSCYEFCDENRFK